MKVKCVVAAINSNGSPDLFLVQVECTHDEFNDGLHYDKAINLAELEGYEPKLVIDEHDDGFDLINTEVIDWDGAPEV